MSVFNEKAEFVLCLQTDESGDLTIRKVYQVLPDEAAARDDYIRIIDECGEDYLYPAAFFVPIQLPESATETLLAAW